MTDGTTGFQVAPITEEDMSKVHQILQRAVDSIVGMSQLKHDVDEMQARMGQMSDELDRLRRTNDALEESLSQSRRQRQDIEARAAELQRTSNLFEERALKAEADAQNWHDQFNRANLRADDLHTERDDAQLKAMELEDELAKAKGLLDKLREVFGSEPKAMPQTSAEAPAHPYPEPVFASSTPTRHYLDGWQAGALWDSSEQRYYIES